MSDLLKVLTDTKELLADPNRWTTSAAARNADGKAVAPTSSSACTWCLDGALMRCAVKDDKLAGFWEALYLVDRAARELYPDLLHIQHPDSPICSWVEWQSAAYLNDTQGHEAVLRVLDYAMTLVQP